VGWLTAGITAFYMFRMYFSTFEGEFKGTDKELLAIVKADNSGMAIAAHNDHESHASHDEHHASEPHESPLSMTFPLMALIVPSILIGLVGTPFGNFFEEFIHAPGEVVTPIELGVPEDIGEFLTLGGASVAIALVGIGLAVLMYLTKKISPEAIAAKIQPLYQLSKQKWYFNEIYDAAFVKGSRRLARQVLEVDSKIVDGIVNLAGFVTLVSGEGLKYFENGRAQFYALVIFLGVLGLVVFSNIG
jgi:NAD(P)H-quinone oxidoreductase subunit 5